MSCQNTIICLTSNLGSDILAEEGSTEADGVVSKAARDAVIERTELHFPPELLNRLDATVVFNKLSRESILSVVDLRLADVSARIKDRRITLDVDESVRQWLADKGYSEVYGARAIARVVRSEVLFPLAQKLLTGTIRYALPFPLLASYNITDLSRLQEWRHCEGLRLRRQTIARVPRKPSCGSHGKCRFLSFSARRRRRKITSS